MGRAPTDEELDELAGLLVGRLKAVADMNPPAISAERRRSDHERHLRRLKAEALPVWRELKTLMGET